MSEVPVVYRSWPGVIAMILAIGVSVGLCGALIIVSMSSRPVSQQFAGVLSALAGATVGALATYLGGANGRPPDASPASDSGPEPES
ncbi:hypothetical protein [Streptomyces murinus]|uniref:hypothetical protein n=1 Tax=Streptomyces murinus TaxID=33900 RepID=UPI003F46B9A1